MKKKILGTLALLAPGLVLAADGTTTYTVPTEVSNAVSLVQDAGTKLAVLIVGMCAAVGAAFLGVWAIKAVFRAFRGSAAAGR